MKRILRFLFLILSPAVTIGHAQTFQHFRLDGGVLGFVDYHVASKPSASSKPLLVWLDGSGCMPIEVVFRSPTVCCAKTSTCMLNVDSLAAHYHVVLISKPGVAYADTVETPSIDSLSFHTGAERYTGEGCGRDYNDRLTLSWRAEAASLVLDEMLRRYSVDRRRVIVAGHSEGGPVAAKTATLNQNVTHVGCFSGPGLTQFYDFVLQSRKQMLTGELTPQAAQTHIDSLMQTFAEIMRHPVSDRFWLGHSYKRWAGFAEPTVDNLLRLDIPIFLVSATHDEATAVENADYILLMFAQTGKTNLTWKACVGCDHIYNDTYGWRPGQMPASRMDEVLGWFFQWLAEQ